MQKDTLLQATTEQIIDIVEKNFVDRYSHLSISNRIRDISQKLGGLDDSIDILPIVRKIDSSSYSLRRIFKQPKIGNITTEKCKELTSISGNGYCDGNIILLSSTRPRQKDHYLRFSAIKGIIKEEKFISDLISFSGEKIIMVVGGAFFYDNCDNIIISSEEYPPVILSNPRENLNIDFKFVIGYLKSSIALWYSDRCLGNNDTVEKGLVFDLPIPINIGNNFKEKISNLTKEILDLENAFLQKEMQIIENIKKSIVEEDLAKKEIAEQILDHNKQSDNLLGQIESELYTALNFTDEEIMMIQTGIKANGYAVFEYKK